MTEGNCLRLHPGIAPGKFIVLREELKHGFINAESHVTEFMDRLAENGGPNPVWYTVTLEGIGMIEVPLGLTAPHALVVDGFGVPWAYWGETE